PPPAWRRDRHYRPPCAAQRLPAHLPGGSRRFPQSRPPKKIIFFGALASTPTAPRALGPYVVAGPGSPPVGPAGGTGAAAAGAGPGGGGAGTLRGVGAFLAGAPAPWSFASALRRFIR